MNVTVGTQVRVVKTTTVGFGNEARVSPEIIWEGQDIEQLSTAYPPSEIFGADPLGHSEIEDGYIRFDHRFERLEGDSWIEIDDPRVRVTPLTEMEIEIDAENRRRIPGDYVETCDNCGASDCYGECQDGLWDYDPPEYDCYNCWDDGCELCRPDLYLPKCTACGSGSRDTDRDGLCADCRFEPVEPITNCYECGAVHADPELSDYHVCSECTTEARFTDWDDAHPQRRCRQLINKLLGIRKKNRR